MYKTVAIKTNSAAIVVITIFIGSQFKFKLCAVMCIQISGTDVFDPKG
jgi:hypothetical protein